MTIVRCPYPIDKSDFEGVEAHVIVGDEEKVGRKWPTPIIEQLKSFELPLDLEQVLAFTMLKPAR